MAERLPWEVFTKLAPRLTEEERDWLAKKCAAIGD